MVDCRIGAGRRSSTAPQDEQKLDPSGLRCPHWLQKSAVTRRTCSALDQLPVPSASSSERYPRVVGLDHAEPAFAVRVLVEPLRGVASRC